MLQTGRCGRLVEHSVFVRQVQLMTECFANTDSRLAKPFAVISRAGETDSIGVTP
jgi:hypothetical protein